MEPDHAASGDEAAGQSSKNYPYASEWSLAESLKEESAGHTYAEHLLASLSALRRAGALCDVCLRSCEEHEGVQAHRNVLAASSPYFRAMFTQFDERKRHTITIQDVEPSALEAIVEYMYCPDTLKVTEESVASLLAGASLLQVSGVRTACAKFLRRSLAPENAIGIKAFAELYSCLDLAHAASQYIEEHFVDIVGTEEFYALSADTLASIIKSDQIRVPSEETVLDAVIKWIQHDPENRRRILGQLLEHVRLPLLPSEVLVKRAGHESLTASLDEGDVKVKNLLIEALIFHLVTGERQAEMAATNPRAQPRKRLTMKLLLVAGGQAPKAIREVEYLDLVTGIWRRAADLPSRRCRAGLALVNSQVYIVGGFNGTLRVRTVDVYDVATGQWMAGPQMSSRRSTLGVAAIGTRIYAIGGFDGTTGLSTCEFLETKANTPAWRQMAGMSTRRSSVGVAVLDGMVYAVGGYTGSERSCLSSVERYDPKHNVWQAVPDMSLRRSGAGVGVLGDALYAVGGHDGPTVRRSVERYREGEGWTSVPCMTYARRNAGVVSHDGKLYVVGGDDGANNLATVEVYDPILEQWSLLQGKMTVGRSYAGVCVFERLS